MVIRKFLTGLGIITVICNFLLLVPSPFAQFADSATYYASQKKNITEAELQKMGISRDKFERGITFSSDRKSSEILLRFWVSITFFLTHLRLVYLSVRFNSILSRVGLAVTASIFLIGWLASILSSPPSSGMTVLDGYVFRILNEWTLDSWLWFTRFTVLFCIAPLAYITLLAVLFIRGEPTSPYNSNPK